MADSAPVRIELCRYDADGEVIARLERPVKDEHAVASLLPFGTQPRGWIKTRLLYWNVRPPALRFSITVHYDDGHCRDWVANRQPHPVVSPH